MAGSRSAVLDDWKLFVALKLEGGAGKYML